MIAHVNSSPRKNPAIVNGRQCVATNARTSGCDSPDVLYRTYLASSAAPRAIERWRGSIPGVYVYELQRVNTQLNVNGSRHSC